MDGQQEAKGDDKAKRLREEEKKERGKSPRFGGRLRYGNNQDKGLIQSIL